MAYAMPSLPGLMCKPRLGAYTLEHLGQSRGVVLLRPVVGKYRLKCVWNKVLYIPAVLGMVYGENIAIKITFLDAR